MGWQEGGGRAGGGQGRSVVFNVGGDEGGTSPFGWGGTETEDGTIHVCVCVCACVGVSVSLRLCLCLCMCVPLGREVLR